MVVRILNFSLLVCLVPYVWMNLTLTHDNHKYLQHNRGLLKRLLIPHHIDYHALTTPEMLFPSNEYWQATWQWKARRAFLNLCRISHTSKRKRCQISQTFGNLLRYPRSIWDCCHDLVVLMQFLGTQSNWVNTETKISSFWRNFNHWLHWKLSFWQLPVQPVTKISSKWRHFRFSECSCYVQGGVSKTLMSS